MDRNGRRIETNIPFGKGRTLEECARQDFSGSLFGNLKGLKGCPKLTTQQEHQEPDANPLPHLCFEFRIIFHARRYHTSTLQGLSSHDCGFMTGKNMNVYCLTECPCHCSTILEKKMSDETEISLTVKLAWLLILLFLLCQEKHRADIKSFPQDWN